MRHHYRRAWVVAASALLSLGTAPVVTWLASATPARAQTCQYPSDCPTTSTVPPSTTPGNTTTTIGGTTTTTAGGTGPTVTSPPQPGEPALILILDVTSSAPGATASATICNAPLNAVVQVTFNGVVVATATATDGTCPVHSALGHSGGPIVAALGPIGHLVSARVQAQTSGSGVAKASFTVPNLGVGVYLVCASSPGRASACANFRITDSASVLGTSFSNGTPLVSASNPKSFLAFTGMGLVRLVLLALVLIALGWFLVRRRSPRRA